jgi:RND superfamily putative drug exporter
MTKHGLRRFSLAWIIRRLSVPILLFWLAMSVVTNVLVPPLEKVGAAHTVSLSPEDAPSLQATKRIGRVFQEFDADGSAMIILEGDTPLGDGAHRFYDDLIRKLSADRRHVEHIQDFWGDPLTAGGSQSSDGKAAYVQLYLAGNQGEALSNESVNAVRDIVAHSSPPAGLKAYVAGAAPVTVDQLEVGNKSVAKVTAITMVVIAVMLLFVYRSILTTVLIILMIFIELAVARGAVAFLGNANLIGLSTYSVNILTLLVIAAGTDYAIFFIGRYQEARQDAQDREAAYYTMFHGVVHVVLGSGLTIAGALYCLSFTRLPYFSYLGVPCAIAVLVALMAALTVGPAAITIGSRFGFFEAKRTMRIRGWRRLGAAIVRWPGPILAVTCFVALIGLLALPGYKTSYNDRRYLPADASVNVAYTAAERHFSQARLNPELLMIESDHDLRDPADMILLERIAKAVFHTSGIARVQSITRPLGTPIDHSSIPFQISQQSTNQIENLKYQQDRAADLLKQANVITTTINALQRQFDAQKELNAATSDETEKFRETIATVDQLRDQIANFDDFLRPLRNYFYWEPHCADIPACWATRSLFDSIDTVDALRDELAGVSASLAKINAIEPKLLAQIPPQIASQQTNRDLILSNFATTSGINQQAAAALQNATAMGQAFDTAKNDDSFYLPPEAFDNADFKRGLKLFLSPDGKAARMIITHTGDPATPEDIAHIDPIQAAAHEAVKGTPLEGARISLAGTASTFKDVQDGAKYDLLIAGISALSLVLIIMMIITRSIVAALVIVGTVALSLGASFGLSVLVWQYICGIDLHWIVLALAVILLLAVGSDYNLLLISRFKEEIGAGLNTGIIRAMGGTGSVVTAAGLVFAATMSSFVFSDLRIVGQMGTTIGLGLLFDTLIVRSFMMPSIAALLGRWFWWPLKVRQRPKPTTVSAAG